MALLKDIMRCNLTNWQSRLPRCWRESVGDVCLNLAAFDPSEGEDDPVCDTIWPRDEAMFKAFQKLGVAPYRVRVVILGNDPYSKEEQVTGRAFEQCDVTSFNNTDSTRNSLTVSLRSLILAVLMTECCEGVVDGLADCRKLRDQIDLFNSWEDQGVMWLNASLTFSCKDHRKLHRKLWKPFTKKVLATLCEQTRRRPVIFALWGKKAQKWSEFIQEESCAVNFHVLRNNHPSSGKYGFFVDRNPLLAINEKLESFGCGPINWYLRSQ